MRNVLYSNKGVFFMRLKSNKQLKNYEKNFLDLNCTIIKAYNKRHKKIAIEDDCGNTVLIAENTPKSKWLVFFNKNNWHNTNTALTRPERLVYNES